MTLYPVFDWLELSWIGTVIRESTWLFPVVEAGHLLGLAALGGAVLVVDLRLLGFGFKSRSARYVLDQARPWGVGAIVLMFATGVPLFLSEAVKCYFSSAFWLKMAALALALSFTFLVRDRRLRSGRVVSPGLARALAAVSLALWSTVAAAGRWIGFS